MSWINTYTGRRFHPLGDGPADIDIHDIAHALAAQCRYAGHTRVHYSVAEHSVRMARYFLVSTLEGAWGRVCARYALLHDASEAYLMDLSRPLKEVPGFGFYRDAERALQRKIFRAFELTGNVPPLVTVLDRDIIGTEARALFPVMHPDWTPPADIPGIHGGLRWGWSAPDAERAFLATFDRLWKGFRECSS